MSRSVNGGAVGTHGKSLPVDLDALPKKPARMGIDGKNEDFLAESGVSRALVREAMRRADYSQKSMAIDNKVSESKVSDALSGLRHLPWAWVYTSATTHQSLAFHLVTLLAEHLNINQDVEANEFADLCARMVKTAIKVQSQASAARAALKVGA